MGIGLQEFREDYLREMYSIRGDLDLLNLSRNTTEVKYYSAWIDESLLEPRIAIIPDQYPHPINIPTRSISPKESPKETIQSSKERVLNKVENFF